jgi:hypothetical protein
MAFQIAFVLLNLSIPLWFWMNSGHSADHDAIQWNTLNRNLERLIVNNGGFPPCSSHDLAAELQRLCERSQEKLRDGADTTVDKIGDDIIFTCKVGKKNIAVEWTAQETSDGSLDCSGTKGSTMIYQNPGFEFGYSGRLGRITFTSATGERQTERVSNCRAKLKALREVEPPPASADAVVDAMPAVAGDARDQLSANRLCLTYDIVPDWKAFRR